MAHDDADRRHYRRRHDEFSADICYAAAEAKNGGRHLLYRHIYFTILDDEKATPPPAPKIVATPRRISHPGNARSSGPADGDFAGHFLMTPARARGFRDDGRRTQLNTRDFGTSLFRAIWAKGAYQRTFTNAK